MAITASDIQILLSKSTATAGYAETSTPAASLGKYASTSQMSAGLNTLFDNVTGVENTAIENEYRCVFVLNNHATLDYQTAVAYISAEVAGGANVSIAIDNIAATAKDYAYSQATFIANEDTGPVGVGSFSAPTSAITGLSIGTLAPGQVRAIWVRRTTTNSAALDGDGFTLAVSGETAA